MTAVISNTQLRDILYRVGGQTVPEFVWEWFFHYFGAGASVLSNEPADLLPNYHALISMGIALLENRYSNGSYAKIIKDLQTPQFTYYFVGDTHGSFDDVYQLINYFVQVFQVRSDVKVVWIGDIVDRNPYDLQNLALIMSFWILFPDNVFILRGNHEDPSVCSRYGFSEHLYQKSGSKTTFNPIWDLIIQFFSRLPIGMLCQIGEKRVGVFHGGFPFDPENFKVWAIEEVEPLLNCFKPEYFDMDPMSVSILWADPDPTLSEGVAPNPRTGRPRYSEAAITAFMDKNHLSCIIRGHSKWDDGYRLFFGNRVVSLFSTSTYDNKPIGQAKFLRLQPSTQLIELGEEEPNLGKGVLSISAPFLARQLEFYYRART